MQGTDRALKGTAATPELWGAAYMMLVFATLSRALHAWSRFNGTAFDWEQAGTVSINILICPALLWMAIAFRSLLKSELRKNLLSTRTYKICNFWIPQILILAYITMVL